MASIGSSGEHEFRVLENACVAEGIFEMRFASDVAGLLAPGQFMNFRVPGDGSQILLVPLSFSEADATSSTVTIIYAVVGDGTKRLSEMRPKETSSLIGPCGKGWCLPDADGRVLLVAGGVGLPPILAAARMLAAAGVGFDAVVGARDATHVYGRGVDVLRSLAPEVGCDCERRVLITTDDGSLGIHGFTTDAMRELLARRDYACVMTCGPNPMMAGVARMAEEAGISCQVSLERMMGCGFGACNCCNVALRDGGYASCCTDGPVFDAREVAW